MRWGMRLWIDLCQFTEVTPAVNQVETHVFQQQRIAHKYMEKYGVQHQSRGPFAEGKNDFFTNQILTEIGSMYGKTVAQTALRYLIQSGVVVIPKSTHKERMIQNFQVFDVTLNALQKTGNINRITVGNYKFFYHMETVL